MSGGSVALDTNRAIAVLNGAPGVAQWLAGFSDVFLPAAVIGELKYGALNSQRAKENLDRVERLIASCRVSSCHRYNCDCLRGTPDRTETCWQADPGERPLDRSRLRRERSSARN